MTTHRPGPRQRPVGWRLKWRLRNHGPTKARKSCASLARPRAAHKGQRRLGVCRWATAGRREMRLGAKCVTQRPRLQWAVCAWSRARVWPRRPHPIGPDRRRRAGLAKAALGLEYSPVAVVGSARAPARPASTSATTSGTWLARAPAAGRAPRLILGGAAWPWPAAGSRILAPGARGRALGSLPVQARHFRRLRAAVCRLVAQTGSRRACLWRWRWWCAGTLAGLPARCFWLARAHKLAALPLASYGLCLLRLSRRSPMRIRAALLDCCWRVLHFTDGLPNCLHRWLDVHTCDSRRPPSGRNGNTTSGWRGRVATLRDTMAPARRTNTHTQQ